jgi:hypothetical protein
MKAWMKPTRIEWVSYLTLMPVLARVVRQEYLDLFNADRDFAGTGFVVPAHPGHALAARGVS